MSLNVWLRLETGTPDRCHTSKFCCRHCYQLVFSTILLNAFVIIAVESRQRLQSTSNVLVAWLAGAGLLNGLVNKDIEIAIDLACIFSDGPYCGLEQEMGQSCVNEH